jgi:hypothetical protein
VIYLGFFLPMALTRTLIAKFNGTQPDLALDVGLASLVVTAAAVTVPLVFARVVRGTPLGFLFRRPAAFHIAPAPASPSRLRPGPVAPREA